jgi:hypothetical protein
MTVFGPLIGPTLSRTSSDIGQALRAEPALAGGPADNSLVAQLQQLLQFLLKAKDSFLDVSSVT